MIPWNELIEKLELAIVFYFRKGWYERDKMLKVVDVTPNSAEIRKMANGVPKGLSIKVDMDKISSTDPQTVVIAFTYTVDYEPEVAIVKVKGTALCRDTPENIKKLLLEHKKGKVPLEIAGSAINAINSNVGLSTIFMVRPFNLLPPFMPPALVDETALKGKK